MTKEEVFLEYSGQATFAQAVGGGVGCVCGKGRTMYE